MSLKRAQNADMRMKDTVFGFIRKHEQEKKLNIPMIVKYLSLNYYLMDDHFIVWYGKIKMDETRRVATLNERRCAVHGDFNAPLDSASSNIVYYQWTFQFLDVMHKVEFTIGLDCMKMWGWAPQSEKFDYNSKTGQLGFRNFDHSSGSETLIKFMSRHFDHKRDYIHLLFYPLARKISYYVSERLEINESETPLRMDEIGADVTAARLWMAVNAPNAPVSLKLVQFRVHQGSLLNDTIKNPPRKAHNMGLQWI